jgi:hypothetical protein
MTGRKKSWWGVGIAATYSAFAACTLGFVAFAMTKPVDLVSQDYYQRSLVEDGKILAADNARALGSAVGVTYDAAQGALVARIPGEGASGTITLYRPAASTLDRQIAIAPTAARQTIDVTQLARGRWVVQIEWTADGRPYRHEEGVYLP